MKKIKSLVIKNVIVEGYMYQLRSGIEYEVPEAHANILCSNGFAEMEKTIAEETPVFEWPAPQTGSGLLRKYKGGNLTCCITTDREENFILNKEYPDTFDDFSVASGKGWPSEVHRKTKSIQKDSLNFFLNDDETVSGSINLTLPDWADIGWVTVTTNMADKRLEPRLFRYSDGMHFFRKTDALYDKNGDLLASAKTKGNKYKHFIIESVHVNGTKEAEGREAPQKARPNIAHFGTDSLFGKSKYNETLNKIDSLEGADIIIISSTQEVETDKQIVLYADREDSLMKEEASLVLVTKPSLIKYYKNALWLPAPMKVYGREDLREIRVCTEETMPEALADGCAVILQTTDEVINFYKTNYGYLPFFPVKTKEEEEEAIRQLSEDDNLTYTLIKEGKRFSRKYYEIDKLTPKLNKLYMKLVTGQEIKQNEIC